MSRCIKYVHIHAIWYQDNITTATLHISVFKCAIIFLSSFMHMQFTKHMLYSSVHV